MFAVSAPITMRYLVGMVQGAPKQMSSPEEKVSNRILTVANVITMVRLAMVPMAFILLVSGKNNVAAFIVFAVAASTDWVDGQIARRTDTVTVLGKELDPLVDRFLIAAGVVGLVVVGRLPVWLAVILVARDAVILSGSARMKLLGIPPIPVMFLGKVTTALLMTGFSGLILNWPEFGGLGLIESEALPGLGNDSASVWVWVVYAGSVLSVITGVKYFRIGRETLAQHAA